MMLTNVGGALMVIAAGVMASLFVSHVYYCLVGQCGR